MSTVPVEIIDTHAHLDDAAFDPDRPEVLQRAADMGIRRIVNVGYNPDRWATTRALTETHPGIRGMYGLHPQEAARFSAQTLEALEATLRSSRPVAVGEIGLDYFRGRSDETLQRQSFVAQIDLARRLALPIVIHQRAAESELVEILTRSASLPPVLLHSFDGSQVLADLAISRGWLLGVGGLATKPGRDDLRQVLATVPLANIVLETDAPYLVPAGIRNRRNEPANLATAIHQLADIWGVGAESMAAATTNTAEQFFAIGPVVAAAAAGPERTVRDEPNRMVGGVDPKSGAHGLHGP